MKASLSFAELQDYLLSHFYKSVKLAYVDDPTVEISGPLKVLGFTKQICIQLAVKKIEGKDLFLAYNGKMGIDLLVYYDWQCHLLAHPLLTFAPSLL